MKKISILTIGDELLIGQILNSNVQWISDQITSIGGDVITHLTVGDRESEIIQALDSLLLKCDAIIIGGGLGPTHDDLTMEAVSHYANIPLEYDADWVSKLEVYFKSRNRPMAENNKKQGWLLKDAIRIDNDCGTAAGQHFKIGETDFFIVPGVPHEMKSMMNRYILPELAKSVSPVSRQILKQTLLTTGVGESLLAERLEPFVQKVKQDSRFTLAFLPSNIEVRLRLLMKASSKEDETLFHEWIEELKTLCGKDFYGIDPLSLEEKVITTLKEKNLTVAVAESCTGGFISHRLTQISGSSSVFKGAIVAYQEAVKISELGISPALLKEKGPVSEEVAKAMADAIRKKWNADFGIATTGYLGPHGGDAFAKTGTVYISFSSNSHQETRCFHLGDDRVPGKERATQAALDLLRRSLSLVTH